MDRIIKSELVSLLNRVTRSDADESVYDYYILDPQELITLKQKLADAEKWRVLEKKYPNFCKRFDVTIDALEGEGEKG